MPFLTDALIALIAFAHLWFLALEMFLWRKPLGLKTFRMTPEQAEATAVLAMNQGLYNGFLAAGLAWGLWLGAAGFAVKTFFLACVLIAGLFGGATAARAIFFVQALPAAIALTLLLLFR
ncbi:MAG: DUF1304 domain-containing protein [Candidatus Sericytochromatia bacterium]